MISTHPHGSPSVVNVAVNAGVVVVFPLAAQGSRAVVEVGHAGAAERVDGATQSRVRDR